jgi:hypothetical protein
MMGTRVQRSAHLNKGQLLRPPDHVRHVEHGLRASRATHAHTCGSSQQWQSDRRAVPGGKAWPWRRRAGPSRDQVHRAGSCRHDPPFFDLFLVADTISELIRATYWSTPSVAARKGLKHRLPEPDRVLATAPPAKPALKSPPTGEQPAQPLLQRSLGRSVVPNSGCWPPRLLLPCTQSGRAVRANPDAPLAAPHRAELHKPNQGLIRAGNGGCAS